ncbi:antirestriction protein [Robbsia sp. Bb-Pol-6]|uniref:Antirestriction protein n=1 Tax=Robbsia betulipollinis TaxID=2981849 RepID=A0ABT3ZPD0_9BURK|nr:antirestriction protein [Robbsia betulipollinis]MCY0388411.1 antirestriction protein [Robbsia betulipollinis]
MTIEMEDQPITVKPVAAEMRANFLPTYFGKHFVRGEAMIYDWASRLSLEYSGGIWEFFELSNGGFYLAPLSGPVRVQWDLNGFDGVLSADAFGIVVTMFALCHLVELTRDRVIGQRYHHLRDFAFDHAEAATIGGAID